MKNALQSTAIQGRAGFCWDSEAGPRLISARLDKYDQDRENWEVVITHFPDIGAQVRTLDDVAVSVTRREAHRQKRPTTQCHKSMSQSRRANTRMY